MYRYDTISNSYTNIRKFIEYTIQYPIHIPIPKFLRDYACFLLPLKAHIYIDLNVLFSLRILIVKIKK